MKSLSRRAKIILLIILGLIALGGGILTYLQLTGKVKIWAATPPFTVTPQERSLFVGGSNATFRISPAKKLEVVCSGYNFSKSPSRTVEVVGGTNSGTNISSKKFNTLTSTFEIKALAEGTAKCVFSGIIPSVGKTKIPSLALSIYPAQSGGTTTGGGTTGGSGATTITLDPTSLNLHKGTYQAVYLPAAAAPVVTVQCGGEASVWNGSADVAKATFRDDVTTEKNELNAVSIKAGRNVGSGTCLFYLSADAAVSPAATLPVTSYD